jgi:hypothetical protein
VLVRYRQSSLLRKVQLTLTQKKVDFSPLSTGQILPFGAGALLLYTIYGAVYCLYLSPIAGFPGPKLAALTLWYVGYQRSNSKLTTTGTSFIMMYFLS